MRSAAVFVLSLALVAGGGAQCADAFDDEYYGYGYDEYGYGGDAVTTTTVAPTKAPVYGGVATTKAPPVYGGGATTKATGGTKATKPTTPPGYTAATKATTAVATTAGTKTTRLIPSTTGATSTRMNSTTLTTSTTASTTATSTASSTSATTAGGDLVITLTWAADEDLDLSVRLPVSGAERYVWRSGTTAFNGVKSADATTAGTETITFPAGEYDAGDFQVRVVNSTGREISAAGVCDDGRAVPFTLQVVQGGSALDVTPVAGPFGEVTENLDAFRGDGFYQATVVA